MGGEFGRQARMTEPAAVAASALRRDQAPEGEKAGQAPVPGGVAARGAGRVLLQLQRDFGNRHVQQVVRHALQAGDPAPVTGSGLRLGPAGDRYEQAADRVAQQVAGGARPRRPPAARREDDRPDGVVDDRVRRAIQGARGGGQPLPERVRTQAEPVVGADLRRVRLHTDARADELTRLLRARAFTTGPEIFLRRGEYRPDSAAGQRLLAHELTHVAQQTGGTAGAGVIQRMKIEDLDTEVPEDLAKLKTSVWTKDLRGLQQMRGEIEAQLAGGNPDPGVQKLLNFLAIKEKSISRQVQQGRVQPAAARPEPPVARPVPAEPPARIEPPVQVESPRIEQPAAVQPATSDLASWGKALTERAAKLSIPPSGGREAVPARIQEIIEFVRETDKWSTAYYAAGVRDKRSLRGLQSDIESRVATMNQLRRDLPQLAEEQESRRQDAMITERYGGMMTRREQEVAAGEGLVRRYVFKLDLAKLVKAPDSWGKYGAVVPGLFVEWVFSAAIRQLTQDASSWVTALLDYLGRLPKTPEAAAGSDSLPGPVVELRGSGNAAGEAYPNFIGLSIEPAGNADLLELLTSEGAEASRERGKLVTETASTFIHEAAHLRQLRVYDNASFPWHPRPEEMQAGVSMLGGPGSKGVPYEKWPAEVQGAYDEFMRGGSAEKAAGDPHWARFSGTLKRYQRKDDDVRASELVSHLVELAYAWRDEQTFRAVFPEGAALLDKVTKG